MATKEEIQQFIRSQIHQDFFDELEVLLPQTFQKAVKETRALLAHTPAEYLRGQLRHSLVQDALASLRRWSPVVLATDPSGHHYVLLKIGCVRITAVVLPWQKEVREAKHRRELKALNEFLAPTQLDWIDGLQQALDEKLIHALVIVHAPPPNETDQSEPRAITLAVPFFNGKGFHMNCPLEELLGGYSGEALNEQKPMELVVLRDKMQRIEEAEAQLTDKPVAKR
ncbi:hypothetical protein J4P02_27610 [Pseudomonas sp. NFXW11]|uniref:hypothetical protein n=1 Tax=Pseudomonas sp. NFXW11 TaxID=2819531 RepID=UPI003CF9683F